MNAAATVLQESKYHTLTYRPRKQEAVFTFYRSTESMETYDYWQIMREANAALQKLPVRSVIFDYREFMFTFDPDFQGRIVEEVVPIWSKNGIRKVAVIAPDDYIAKIAVTQIVDDASMVAPYEHRLFDSLDQAQTWLAA